jgi:hypothetical protein
MMLSSADPFSSHPPPNTPEQRVNLDGLLLAVGDFVGPGVIDEVAAGPRGARSGGLGGPGGFGGRGGRGRSGRGEPSNTEGAQRVLVPEPMGSSPGGAPGFDFGGGGFGPTGPNRVGLRVVVRGDRKSEGVDVEMVLKRVSEQAGLTPRLEKRSVRTLVVEESY